MTRELLKMPLALYCRWLWSKLSLEHRYRGSHLQIGYMSRILNCSFGQYNTIANDVYMANVTLGDFTYVADHTHLQNVQIGRFCSIGPEARCGLGRHPSHTFVSTHPIFYSQLRQAQVTFVDRPYFAEFANVAIGNDVWLGARCLVVDGVRIGDGAMIAAGAVVVSDVEPYAIVGGVPARVLKYRFAPDQIARLLRLCWWNWDQNWLQDHYRAFHDINTLLSMTPLPPDSDPRSEL